MKLNYFLGLLFIISIVSFGCSQAQVSSDESIMEENSMVEKDLSSIDESMEKSAMDKENMMKSESVTINLNQQSGSGQSGQLVLAEAGEKTKAVLTVANYDENVGQPAHLHESSCDDLGPVAYPLNNVLNGRSETMIDISFDKLISELTLSVNVHKSSAEPGIYVSCGDITLKGMNKLSSEEENLIMPGYNGNILTGTSSKYIEFNKADYDKAISENKKILLYFYANWCPICKAEQPETFAAFNELNDPNIIGFRVNYKDSETDEDEEALAKEFGVAYQHTKVILKDGKQVAKFPDSWNKQRYLDELAKA